jgi:hypothetical protein
VSPITRPSQIMATDRMEQASIIQDLALSRSSNLFNCNGVPTEDGTEHECSVAYVAHLFTIAAALRERAVEELF